VRSGARRRGKIPFANGSGAVHQILYLPFEEQAYRVSDAVSLNRQFVVQDPDGYLLRFAQID
jgi:hypothetical protein